MNRLFAVSLFTLMMLTSLALTAQTTVFKSNLDGEFASVDQSGDPSSSFNLSVSRNLTKRPQHLSHRQHYVYRFLSCI